jgi:hypothetical protein
MNNISEAIVKDYALALNRVRSAQVLEISESAIQEARDEMARMREAVTVLWPGVGFDLELAAMNLINSVK